MNRKEIKEKAKSMVKDNKWLILKPLALIWLISFGVGFVCGFMGLSKATTSIITDICSVVTGILGGAYYAYLLKFVRTGSASIDDVINCFKEKWLKIFIVTLLVGIFIFLWSLLFIIPGIVATYAYTWAVILVIDKDMEPKEAIKESKSIMKGYKWDYFVFELSFFGWILLSIFTFGILFIWLVPYIMVANILYYEALTNKN